MTHHNWGNPVTKFYYDRENVRDPTIVFNNVAEVYGTALGYTGTDYEMTPLNFAPNINVASPTTWTEITLTQFAVPDSCRVVILTGNAAITGTHALTGTIYLWFRTPGSTWSLSPIFDGGYLGNVCIHVPVALNGSNVPAFQMAWGTQGLTTTNWGTGAAVTDNATVNLILSSWGE